MLAISQFEIESMNWYEPAQLVINNNLTDKIVTYAKYVS